MINAPVLFENPLEHLADYLKNKAFTKLFILVDENTKMACFPILEPYLNNLDYQLIEIKSGENHKNIETVGFVWNELGKNGADRKSLIINLGGGVLTDMGGFIASTFKRGIAYINIPTTLLSMVDASVGGKNGIDFMGLKNQIGTFTQPEMVLVEPKFLDTLEQRQIMSGLAEMLKHGLIADKTHWKNLVQLNIYNAKTLAPFIEDSVAIKKQVVEKDPHESGLRKILNFGHTVGHAIESEYLTKENSLLHGEAIIIGMLIETVLSYQLNFISENDMNEVFNGFGKIYTTKFNIKENDLDTIFSWLTHDKKNIGNQLRLSLLHKIGEANYDIVCSLDQITEAIRFYNEKINS